MESTLKLADYHIAMRDKYSAEIRKEISLELECYTKWLTIYSQYEEHPHVLRNLVADIECILEPLKLKVTKGTILGNVTYMRIESNPPIIEIECNDLPDWKKEVNICLRLINVLIVMLC